MPRINLVLPRPHAGQQRVFAESQRFNVACMGRRFGKSVAAVDRLVHPALAGRPVAYFLPTHKMMAEVWRATKTVLAPVISRISTTEHRIELMTGGVVDFWSLQNADSIRGRRYQRVIIDEAAMVPNLGDAWQQVIRPTLTDFKGDAWFLSTPKGRNFFWECWQRGQPGGDPGWQSWQMPTTANPFIDPAEVEAARRELPELVYTQEYLAAFLEDGAGLFRKVLQSAIAEQSEAGQPGGSYVFGVDWARSGDYTVISVIDTRTHAAGLP